MINIISKGLMIVDAVNDGCDVAVQWEYVGGFREPVDGGLWYVGKKFGNAF